MPNPVAGSLEPHMCVVFAAAATPHGVMMSVGGRLLVAITAIAVWPVCHDTAVAHLRFSSPVG